MGWYDHEEEAWLPEWAVAPIMWIGCVMVAVLPAGVALAFVQMAWPEPPAAIGAGLYVVSLGLMIAAVKPWTVR